MTKPRGAQSSADTQDTAAASRYTADLGGRHSETTIMQKTASAHSVSGSMVQTSQAQGSKPIKYHKLSNVDLAAVVEQYREGIPLPELAEQLGCAKSSLSEALRKVAGDEWASAKEAHYENLLDDGLMGLRAVRDDPNLARGYEAYLRRVEWRASVEHPRWQQQRPSTAIQVSGDGLHVNVVSYSSGNASGKEDDGDDDASQVIDIE